MFLVSHKYGNKYCWVQSMSFNYVIFVDWNKKMALESLGYFVKTARISAIRRREIQAKAGPQEVLKQCRNASHPKLHVSTHLQYPLVSFKLQYTDSSRAQTWKPKPSKPPANFVTFRALPLTLLPSDESQEKHIFCFFLKKKVARNIIYMILQFHICLVAIILQLQQFIFFNFHQILCE